MVRQRTIRASLPKCCALLGRQALFPAQGHPTCSRPLDPIHLPLGTELGLKLRNGSEHVEQQMSSRITGVDMLIEDLQVHLLAVEFGGNLAQMQCGAGEPVQAGHDEGIPFPDIFQTGL
jgi:hypothetical protein